MHQFKKIGAIGGAITLVLCWPLAVGHIGERVIEDGIAQLSNEGVTAEIVSYKRGYLSSTVETRYFVADPELKEQLDIDGIPTELVVQSNISHGLLSLSAHSTIVNFPTFPLTVDTVTQLNGNTDYQANLQSWSYQSEQTSQGDQVTMSLSPASLSGTATVLGQVTFEAKLPSLQLDFESGEKLMISELSASGDGQKEGGFWLGEQSLSMKKFNVDDTQLDSVFAMDNASYKFVSSQDSERDRIDTQHLVDVAQVTSINGNMTEFSLDFALKSLDSNAFSGLVDLYQRNPSLGQADITEIAPLIETLFARGFQVEMNNMNFRLDEGQFKSNWLLEIPEGTNNVSRDPSVVLPALQGHLDTQVSDGIVNLYPPLKQGVDELMVMEMVKQNDTGYQLKANIEGGELVFENGQKVPIAALFLPLMMSGSAGY